MVVQVRHALGQYEVHIEAGLLSGLPVLLEQALPGRRRVVISDDVVADVFESAIQGAAPVHLSFPAGELSKNRETWARLSDDLLTRGLGRDSGVVAFGGGVTGDLAGFVAATYMRGIPYVQVPTTLLAMVDAAVGGKVGVDTRFGKNLIGAFHPPALVVADPQTLLTLPDREFRSGLAETVKHGLIGDAGYFDWIEAQVAQIQARDLAALTELVRRSVEIKALVVSEDEREAGRREILNAGHTVAHALEQVTRYTMPHGEAVALGLVTECRLAARLGVAEPALAERVASLLRALGLPVELPRGLASTALVAAMQLDKKKRGDEIRMALPSLLGRVHRAGSSWSTAIPREVINAELALADSST
jgi:3-dehydroquinate synthase